MIYTDTRDSKVQADFRTAVMSGMNAETGGLYMLHFQNYNRLL